MQEATMRRDQVYEVFARKESEQPLTHVGNVNAPDPELAQVYAWTTYDEENWIEMCVIPRQAIIRVHWESADQLLGG